MILCPSFGMMNMSTHIIGTARADYVDASNNTSCIEEDPLVPGWSKDVRLTNDSATSNHPDIAIDSNNTLHVVYEDHRTGSWEIWYKCSKEGGKIWSTDRNLFDFPGTDATASIAAHNTTIHVVWRHLIGDASDIWYIKSEDSGESWGEPVQLTDADQASLTPKIAVYENTLHVAWFDRRDGDYEIYYKKSSDGGDTWGEDVRLTNSTGFPRIPSIAVDSIGGVHIIWEDKQSGGYDIYYIKSMDQGISWSNVTRLTYGEAQGDADLSPLSDICVDIQGRIHIVWGDIRSEGSGGHDIFFKGSKDGGDTWEEEENITKHNNQNASV